MCFATSRGNWTPRINNSLSDLIPSTQASNGERQTYQPAQKNPTGQARNHRTSNQMMAHKTFMLQSTKSCRLHYNDKLPAETFTYVYNTWVLKERMLEEWQVWRTSFQDAIQSQHRERLAFEQKVQMVFWWNTFYFRLPRDQGFRQRASNYSCSERFVNKLGWLDDCGKEPHRAVKISHRLRAFNT